MSLRSVRSPPGRPRPCGGEIVHDHDVAGVQRRREEGLGIGGENLSVHGAVDDYGGGQAVEAQARDQRRGFPMAMRHRGTAAVAARGAPTQAGHLCGCASLVEEHQPCRIEIRLEGEPSIAPDSHILALLFAGVGSLFLNVTS